MPKRPEICFSSIWNLDLARAGHQANLKHLILIAILKIIGIQEIVLYMFDHLSSSRFYSFQLFDLQIFIIMLFSMDEGCISSLWLTFHNICEGLNVSYLLLLLYFLVDISFWIRVSLWLHPDVFSHNMCL